MQLSGSRDPPTFTVSDPHRLFLKRESLKRFRFGLACAQSRETSQVSLTVLKGERQRNKDRKCRARRPRCGTRAFLLSRDKRYNVYHALRVQ